MQQLMHGGLTRGSAAAVTNNRAMATTPGADHTSQRGLFESVIQWYRSYRAGTPPQKRGGVLVHGQGRHVGAWFDQVTGSYGQQS